MFDQYQRVVVINLPERVDRRRQMESELKAIGAAERVRFFPACKPQNAGPFQSKGEHGCYLSHLTILKEAAAANESVLILEDDCDFTAAVRRPRPQSDLMWGGYKIHEEWIEGSHCMGFSAATVHRVVPYLEQLMIDGPIPMDGSYIWFCRDNPDIVVDACNPPIAVQRPSRSDIKDAGGLPHNSPITSIVHSAKRAVKRRMLWTGDFQQLVERLREARLSAQKDH